MLTVKVTTCPCCGKNSKTLNAAAQHYIRCKLNPDRITVKLNFVEYNNKLKKGLVKKEFYNHFDKATKLNLPKPVDSAATKRKRSEAAKKQVWTESMKQRHSEIMKAAVSTHPESYTSSNRGRTKQIEYDGIKFQGSWELKFYKWCKEKNIKCERNAIGFSYIWNGNRTYYPDFYLPEFGYYVEVKGYKTDRDDAKWNQFPKKLLIIEKQSMIDITNDRFEITPL
jgi:hypothetical protein